VKTSRFFRVLTALLTFLGVSSYAGDVSFSIRYYDKRIYHLTEDPILVEVTVTNYGASEYKFKLAEDRAFSLDFIVKTTTNRELPPADKLLRKRTTGAKVFFREITIDTDESFSFIEDLRDYADLSAPGSYVVQSRIYPELYRPVTLEMTDAGVSPEAQLDSNRLGLILRGPMILDEGGLEQALDEVTGEVLARDRLPPDEVVSYMLRARQRNQWVKFFLYLDLEAMLARNPSRQREWRMESEEGRRRMLTRYREELQQSKVEDITVIPQEFTIEKTEYNSTEGVVIVLEKFRYPGYTHKKRYTYYLSRKNDIWTIVDYSVTDLGTE